MIPRSPLVQSRPQAFPERAEPYKENPAWFPSAGFSRSRDAPHGQMGPRIPEISQSLRPGLAHLGPGVYLGAGPAPEALRESANGRTADSDSASLGSNPSSPAN